MNNVSFDDLITLVKKYNKDEIEDVTKAYEIAKKLHQGQKRESGEDYITHPVNVAYILALMHADKDTLCAGLLHDVIEDTSISKHEIEELFNSDIANLVDGVSKINKIKFTSKADEEYANTRKIITGITNDARIIIIKLADRLHNMRTLEYKTPFKQKENAIETMEIYVPFASYLGGFNMKSELEDLSFKFLKPDIFEKVKEYREKTMNENKPLLSDMIGNIGASLNEKDINNDLTVKEKNIYSIYKKMTLGQTPESIHDMLALNLVVDSVDNCYLSLGQVHKLYNPYNPKFKDYICNPKPNMYQSLHTTLFSGDRFVQVRIKTNNMDLVGSYGIMADWYINKGNARHVMEEDLKNKFQFFESLNQINSTVEDNQEFVTQIKTELFSDRVYVYDLSGQLIDLPKGANIIDFAYKLDQEIADRMVGALVNNRFVTFDYVLQNRDRVKLLTDKMAYHDNDEWESIAQTSYAKKLIKKYK